MRRIHVLIFILIFAIASFFRLYNLASDPPHPTLDEVSTGYNAYSILKTGKDEFGHKLPILLQAYDDWRPALYTYIVIPFVKILGLNILAIRLPSALLSVIGVVSSYFIAKEIVLLSRLKQMKNNSFERFISQFPDIIPLFTMFLFAISPWHIYISRLGHEVNAGFTFFLLGLLFFLIYISNVSKNTDSKYVYFYLILSAIFWGLSFDSYQSEKVFVPIMLATLAYLYYPVFFKRKVALFVSSVIGFIIILPMLAASLSPQALIRFQATNVFEDPKILKISSQKLLYDKQHHDILGYIYDNRRAAYARVFLQGFLSHLNPEWLFTNKGNENFKVPDQGLLHLIELPLIILGIFFIIISSFLSRKVKIFLASWTVAAIIPGGVTTDAPHAMRIMTLLPLPHILSAAGASYITYRIINAHGYIKIFSGLVFFILLVLPAGAFYHAYFTHFNTYESYRFQYGVLDALSYARAHEKNFDSIVISNRGNLRASYMYFLFVNKFPPALYQKQGGTGSGWFNTDHFIGKYTFKNPRENLEGNPLLVLDPGDIPPNELRIIQKISFLDGKDAVWIALKK